MPCPNELTKTSPKINQSIKLDHKQHPSFTIPVPFSFLCMGHTSCCLYLYSLTYIKCVNTHELVSSAKMRAPKYYYCNSAKILPECQNPEGRNDDSTKRMKDIALLLLSFYLSRKDLKKCFTLSTFCILTFDTE